MILLVEHPVLLFQLYCGQVLLVGPLLIVEREEESVEIKPLEVLFAIEQRHCREHVVFLESHWVLRLLNLLVLRLRNVSV